VILSVVGMLALRPPLMRWLIGGALLYQIIIHIPVNYEHRYSVGALDLWLILFSAIGMAYFISNNRSDRPPLKRVAVLMLMFAAIGYGEWHRINSPPLMPNILAVPHDVIWKREGNDLAALRGAAIVSEGEGKYRLDGDHPALYLPVRDVKELYYGANYVLSFTLSVQDADNEKSCLGQVFYKRHRRCDVFREPEYFLPYPRGWTTS
jgi:hypothetical protein